MIRWEQTRARSRSPGSGRCSTPAPTSPGSCSRVDVKKHARYGYADSGYYHGYYRKYYVNQRARHAWRGSSG